MFSKPDLPFLAILRGVKEENLQALLDIFLRTKIHFVEITMNTTGAADLIKKMKSLAKDKMKIGAGTVLNITDLDNALSAGAEFIVSPSVIDDVIHRCIKESVPVIPGALTPTEVHKVWEMGASMVKLFPASSFGPSYIKTIKGPLDSVKIMAVGGVDEQNINEFFSNGADAIAFGGSILKQKWLQESNYNSIEESIQALIAGYQTVINDLP